MCACMEERWCPTDRPTDTRVSLTAMESVRQLRRAVTTIVAVVLLFNSGTAIRSTPSASSATQHEALLHRFLDHKNCHSKSGTAIS
jgi:hypothetical protein